MADAQVAEAGALDEDDLAEAEVDDSPQDVAARRQRVVFRLVLLAIVVFAGVVRVLPLAAALPYTSYIDEGFTLHPAAHTVVGTDSLPGRTWEHTYYEYPSLLPELTAVTVKAWSFLNPDLTAQLRYTDRAAASNPQLAEGSPVAQNYDQLEPRELLLSGRFVVWLAALGTVVLTIVLARLIVGRRAAVLAGVVVAVMPVLVSRSAITIVDTPATFFAMAAIVFAAYAGSRRRTLLYSVMAGVAAGLAFTCKYPSGSVVAVLVVVLLLRKELPWRTRLAGIVAAGLSAVVAALLIMPDLLLKTHQIVAGVQRDSTIYEGKSGAMSYFTAMLQPSEMGITMAVVAAIGVVVLVLTPRARSVTLGWLTFVAFLLIAYLRYDFQPLRDLLPLFPFGAVAVAAAVLEATRWVGRAFSLGRLPRDAVAVVLTLAVALPMFFGGVVPFLDQHVNVVDTRTTTFEWLKTHTTADEKVLVAQELGFLPAQLEQIPAHVVVAPAVGTSDSTIDLGQFDYVVTGDFGGDSPWGAQLGTSSTPVLVHYGTHKNPIIGWHTNNQRIYVYR